MCDNKNILKVEREAGEGRRRPRAQVLRVMGMRSRESDQPYLRLARLVNLRSFNTRDEALWHSALLLAFRL